MTEVRSASPDGRYLIRVHPWEARMSHWVESPEIADAQTGEVLLRFGDAHWSLDGAVWQGSAVVRLGLRKYPGAHRPSVFEVFVDCEARAAVFEGQELELGALEAALERACGRGRPFVQNPKP